MKLRALAATASAAFIFISLAGSGRASATDLGTVMLGDSISMGKSCAAADPADPASPFADLHIASGHHPAWSLGIDPQITSFVIDATTTNYSYDTTAQGVGDFTVIIHCWDVDPHDPISQEYIYTFTVAPVAATTTTTTSAAPTPTVAGPGAPAATTTTVATIPAAGTSSTTSIALVGAAAILVGAALLLVRRRIVT